MLPIDKVVIILMSMGAEKGQRIIELMDNSEIKAVVPRIKSLTVISPEIQECVWREFRALGYEDDMKAADALTIIRFLFNGSTIRTRGAW